MKKSTNDQSASGPALVPEAVDTVIDTLAVSAESNLIGVLQEVQARLGYLPPEALEAVSRRIKIPLSRIYGVVSFYAQFYTEPHGRHTIRCCRGTACHVRGGKRVIDAVKAELGIEEEQTTEDMMFTLQTVACLGACALGPVMVVDSTYYGNMDPRKALGVVQMYQEDSG